MSLQPEKLPEIPAETARIAHMLHPKGNRYMWLRDELGAIYTDEQFLSLYPTVGQLAEQPWRLALMCLIQYMENYTDRQLAEAVKNRIDLKYTLSLELTDPGCDFSVLSEFRSRVVKGGLEEVFLTTLLSVCQERSWLKERGKQRTDSTHIEAHIRVMNRIECVGETLRAALNSISVVIPEWIQRYVPQNWHERYDTSIGDFRLPKETEKRQALAEQIGRDGFQLLEWIYQGNTPSWLCQIPTIEILRQVWIQQFMKKEEQICWRSNENIPPASLLIASPYDHQARMSRKRETSWTGYKVHYTETCDDTTPHLIINVETTQSTVPDMEMTDVIHQDLEHKQLLPSEHLMDTGYVNGEQIVTSQKQYTIDLIGPVAKDGSWQTKEPGRYNNSQFSIHWENKEVTCPENKTSKYWTVSQNRHGKEVVRAQFDRNDCIACPTRSLCTRAEANPRQITVRPQEQHQAIQAARLRQTTKEFKNAYAKRSGIEGTISQGVRAFDLRVCRYLGKEKTHLQHLIIATAMNVARLYSWFRGDTPSPPRVSCFAALAA
jgi:transposase